MPTIAVVTGATSGIGKLIAERIPVRTDWDVLATGEPTQDPPTGARFVAADLASLASIPRLVEAIAEAKAPLGPLVLAAGRQDIDNRGRSADGYELTFAVNVLANVALIDALLAARLVPARIVWFSSGTHDPAKRAGLPTPRHASARLLAHPEEDEAAARDKARTRGARAYSASKLAVAMLCYAYARAHPALRIDAFDPQLTPGTGLARHQSLVIRMLWHGLLPALVPLVPFMNRPKRVAEAAIDVALASAAASGRYIEVRRGKAVEGRSSTASYDVAAQDALLADCRSMIRAPRAQRSGAGA